LSASPESESRSASRESHVLTAAPCEIVGGMSLWPRVALLLGACFCGCSLQDVSALNRCTGKAASAACPLSVAGTASVAGATTAAGGSDAGAPTDDLVGGAAGAGYGNLPMAGDGAGGPAVTPPDLRVQYAYFTADNDPSTDTPAMSKSIRAELQVVNHSPVDVPLSEITLRYYYTSEAAPATMWKCQYVMDSAVANDCDGISVSFASYTSKDGLANAYFEVSFTGDVAAGWLLGANGGPSGPIELTVSKTGYALQDLTNDYSWNGELLTLTDWPKITLQRNGELVFGTPP
jgi:Cellulose binding domain